jgi:chemotaxis protein CheY-P-specific phosphatase CheC
MITLTELERDALTEIFNIGVGLAADVLTDVTQPLLIGYRDEKS